MWNFSLLAATRSIETSMPFVLYRLMIYLAISLAFLFATLAGAGTMIAFASFSANPTALANLGALLGFAGLGTLIYRFRGAVFFNAIAGTLALLVEQTRVSKLPEGKAQIEFAKKAAAERFTPSSFFEVSDALQRALQSLPTPVCPILDKIGNTTMRNIVDWLTRRLASRCAQPVMALHFASTAENPWQSAERGLLIQSSNAAPLLKYRLYGLVFELAGFAGSLALLLYPVNAAISLLPIDVGFWRYVFALAFAWTLKGALFSPIATAAMAQLYLAQYRSHSEGADVQCAALAREFEAVRYIHEKAG